MYYVSRIFGGAALAGLGVAVWFAIVLARADFYFREGTPETVERAAEIAPRNTEYLATRALEVDYEGGDSRAVWERIADLNPYASAPRIRLGLAAEMAGDPALAERWLLDAARVDHQFEARWTLTNFYFRAERWEEFWKWMRAALEVSYGDRTPAFELCWRASGDGDEILKKAIPERHEVVGAYLRFVLNNKPAQSRLPPKLAAPQEAVVEVVRRVAAYHEAADLGLLLGACDRLIKGRDPAALEVWTLAGLGQPAGVFNGDFATAPLNHGFDWRVIEAPGVTDVGNRISLSGRQAEECTLLEQTLSVGAGKRYRLQWESRAPSGLEWRIAGERGGITPGVDWTEGSMTFQAADRFPMLELAYKRPVGEARAEGNVELRRVWVVEAP